VETGTAAPERGGGAGTRRECGSRSAGLQTVWSFCESRSADPQSLALAAEVGAAIARTLRHAGVADQALRVFRCCLRTSERLFREDASARWTSRCRPLLDFAVSWGISLSAFVFGFRSIGLCGVGHLVSFHPHRIRSMIAALTEGVRQCQLTTNSRSASASRPISGQAPNAMP